MKRISKMLITVVFFLALNSLANAQIPPPPPPGGGQGGSGNVPGGDAPVSSGLGILLALGAVYGIKKDYQLNKNENE